MRAWIPVSPVKSRSRCRCTAAENAPNVCMTGTYSLTMSRSRMYVLLGEMACALGHSVGKASSASPGVTASALRRYAQIPGAHSAPQRIRKVPKGEHLPPAPKPKRVPPPQESPGPPLPLLTCSCCRAEDEGMSSMLLLYMMLTSSRTLGTAN